MSEGKNFAERLEELRVYRRRMIQAIQDSRVAREMAADEYSSDVTSNSPKPSVYYFHKVTFGPERLGMGHTYTARVESGWVGRTKK